MSRYWRPRPLVCQDFVEMVSDYLAGDLTLDAAAAAEEHLASCEHCPIYLQQFRRTLQLIANTRDENRDISPGLLQTLSARAHQRHP